MKHQSSVVLVLALNGPLYDRFIKLARAKFKRNRVGNRLDRCFGDVSMAILDEPA
jgi:hypothetical protein